MNLHSACKHSSCRAGFALLLAVGSTSAETEVFATSPPEFKLLGATSSAPAFQEVLGSINPWGIECHPDTGLIYFSDPTGGIIGSFDPEAAIPVVTTIVNRPFGALHGIALDAPRNRLFFLDSADDSINVIGLATLIETPLISGNGITRPNDLAYDPELNCLYVTDSSGTNGITILTDTGTVIDGNSTPEMEGAWGIAIHPGTGDVVFSSFENGAVYQLGTATPLSATPVVSGLTGPRGLEFDRHGQLFCLESGLDRVVKIDIGAGTFAPTSFASALNGRAFILFDGDDKDGDFLLDEWELRYAHALTSLTLPAGISTYNLQWSGASFGNSATASGRIRYNNALFLNPGDNDTDVNPGLVEDFAITISNAATGNGTFTQSDFSRLLLQTGTLPLDFTQELVGQPTATDPWGTSQPGGTGGDFNIFSTIPGAPNGTYYFELTAGGGSGDNMLLTSFAPVMLLPSLTGAIDSDNDGRSALAELLFNTDPSSPADPPQFRTESVGPGSYSIGFQGPSSGYFFDVWFSSDLVNWQASINPLVEGPLSDPLFSTWTITIDPAAEGLDPDRVFVQVNGGVNPPTP